jgi:hypothetical protein
MRFHLGMLHVNHGNRGRDCQDETVQDPRPPLRAATEKDRPNPSTTSPGQGWSNSGKSNVGPDPMSRTTILVNGIWNPCHFRPDIACLLKRMGTYAIEWSVPVTFLPETLFASLIDVAIGWTCKSPVGNHGYGLDGWCKRTIEKVVRPSQFIWMHRKVTQVDSQNWMGNNQLWNHLNSDRWRSRDPTASSDQRPFTSSSGNQRPFRP